MADMFDDDDYVGGDAGASQTFPQQCSALRKNGYVMIGEHPCKIVEMSTSKTGKHGHAKVHMVGIDILSGKKYDDICPSTHNMNVPHVTRKDYQVVDISRDEDGFMSLMTDGGDVRADIKMPDGELGKDIRKRFNSSEQLSVTVLKVLDTEQAIAVKVIQP